MPNCQRCGDFTLLPAVCVDCDRLGPAPAGQALVGAPNRAPAYQPHPDQWDTLGSRPPRPVAPPVVLPPTTPAPYAAARVGYGYPPSATGPWPTSSVRPPTRDPFASLGRRVVAYVLDSVLISVLMAVAAVLSAVLAGDNEDAAAILVIVGWVAVVALYWYLPTARTGRTLGKLALGIRVVRADDLFTPPGYGYGAVRCLVMTCLGAVPLGSLINLAIAGADSPERRAIHDRASGTRVVRADWSPAEGYPLVTRQTPSVTSVVVIAIACVLAAILLAGMLAAIVIPVFLNQRAKGIDTQMRQDAEAAATTLVDAHGTLDFPIVIDEGTEGVIGDTILVPAPGDTITISLARNGSGAFCVRVDNDRAPSPIYLDSAASTIGTTPCGYRGKITITKR